MLFLKQQIPDGRLGMGFEINCTHLTSDYPLAQPELRKMVIWDWYDGPESGLFLCDKCQSEFYFYMVDWSGDHNTRVFALQSIKKGATASLVQLVKEEPGWPIWWPKKLRFPEETDRHWIDRLHTLVLGSPELPRYVLGWSITENMPFSLREIEPGQFQYLGKLLEGDSVDSTFNWFEFLGLIR